MSNLNVLLIHQSNHRIWFSTPTNSQKSFFCVFFLIECKIINYHKCSDLAVLRGHPCIYYIMLSCSIFHFCLFFYILDRMISVWYLFSFDPNNKIELKIEFHNNNPCSFPLLNINGCWVGWLVDWMAGRQPLQDQLRYDYIHSIPANNLLTASCISIWMVYMVIGDDRIFIEGWKSIKILTRNRFLSLYNRAKIKLNPHNIIRCLGHSIKLYNWIYENYYFFGFNNQFNF